MDSQELEPWQETSMAQPNQTHSPSAGEDPSSRLGSEQALHHSQSATPTPTHAAAPPPASCKPRSDWWAAAREACIRRELGVDNSQQGGQKGRQDATKPVMAGAASTPDARSTDLPAAAPHSAPQSADSTSAMVSMLQQFLTTFQAQQQQQQAASQQPGLPSPSVPQSVNETRNGTQAGLQGTGGCFREQGAVPPSAVAALNSQQQGLGASSQASAQSNAQACKTLQISLQNGAGSMLSLQLQCSSPTLPAMPSNPPTQHAPARPALPPAHANVEAYSESCASQTRASQPLNGVQSVTARPPGPATASKEIQEGSSPQRRNSLEHTQPSRPMQVPAPQSVPSSRDRSEPVVQSPQQLQSTAADGYGPLPIPITDGQTPEQLPVSDQETSMHRNCSRQPLQPSMQSPSWDRIGAVGAADLATTAGQSHVEGLMSLVLEAANVPQRHAPGERGIPCPAPLLLPQQPRKTPVSQEVIDLCGSESPRVLPRRTSGLGEESPKHDTPAAADS